MIMRYYQRVSLAKDLKPRKKYPRKKKVPEAVEVISKILDGKPAPEIEAKEG